jgi:subfamily B ATP-binding cassette protein MsbA
VSKHNLTSVDHFGSKQLIKRCAACFWPYRWRVAFAFLSALVVSACNPAIAHLVKPTMNEIFIARDADALIIVPLQFLAVILTKCLARFGQVYVMNIVGYQVLHNLRQQLFSKIIYLPMRFFEESRVGMLMSRVLGDVNAIRQSVPNMIMIIRSICECGMLLGYVIYLNPFLALKTLVVLPLGLLCILYFSKKLRKVGRKLQVQAADINSVTQESLSGVKVVKAFNTEETEKSKFAKESYGVVHLSKKQVLASELSSRTMEFIGGISISFALWYGGSQVVAGNIDAGSFFSFVTALFMLYEPIKKINDANKNVQQALASAERVFGLLDSTEIACEKGGDAAFEPPLGSIEFDHVTFSYPTAGEEAVSDFHLSVAQGEQIALVGPSGSGKTTLVNLIPRFYDVCRGDIRINGRSLPEYDLGSLRRNIGMVSQDAVLFNATIRENICYGMDDVDEAQLVDAAKAAFAHDFISELPEGYETMCGERGVKLSGGQKQRITIARALLKDPALLILDEATSALDTQAERIVQKALDNLMENRTSIVIAHRLSTVLNADKIVVMQKGRIVGMGNHEALLESCDLYNTLHSLQFCQSLSEEDARAMSAGE